MTIHYVVNELSLCGQFNDAVGFRDAIDRVMSIRNEILRYGVSLSTATGSWHGRRFFPTLLCPKPSRAFRTKSAGR